MTESIHERSSPMNRLAFAALAVFATACSAPTRSAAVIRQPVATPKPIEQPTAPTRPMGADAYENGTEALARFMDASDCNGADRRVVAEEVTDLERTIAPFDPSQTPSIRDHLGITVPAGVPCTSAANLGCGTCCA